MFLSKIREIKDILKFHDIQGIDRYFLGKTVGMDVIVLLY